MKFFCEYCGCRIDSEKDSKCPNCGASYKRNATFMKFEKEKKEAEVAKKEEKVMNDKAVVYISKVFLLVFSIVIAIAIIVVTVIALNNNKTILPGKPVTVGINEFAKFGNYKVKVVRYETTTSKWDTPRDGYEFIRFYLNIENLNNSKIYTEEVNCIVDGIAQKSITIPFDDGDSMPFSIEAKLTVKGEKIFEVPKDAKSYDIRYGDYVTIHIEK